ncbi:hypothetical protein S23_36430 [Bradyrhizobium cosmicum]|uniref:Uncharacterized protein n=1 Tax=Bradyrhizobium cosmicum TaxID=1404864 RepID=A0AAI8MF00_9BRAD|nr:hypothetical protein S23_36430 [Bradyrhizobium cosmicum]
MIAGTDHCGSTHRNIAPRPNHRGAAAVGCASGADDRAATVNNGTTARSDDSTSATGYGTHLDQGR